MLSNLDAVEKIEDEFIRDLEKTLRKLQLRLTKYIKDKATDTQIADTALAASDLQGILEDTGFYRLGTDYLSDSYQRILDTALDYYARTYDVDLRYTDISRSHLEALRELDFRKFNSIASDVVDELARGVIDLQFGAAEFNDIVGRIASVSDDTARYAETWVRTATSAAHRTATEALGRELGIERYRYYGPEDGATREFCRDHIDEIKTLDEWQNTMNDDGQSAAIYGGGYNCRHRLVPVGPMK